jgi:hypothetical protein
MPTPSRMRESRIPRLRTHIPRSIPPIPYPWPPLLGAERAGLAVGDVGVELRPGDDEVALGKC